MSFQKKSKWLLICLFVISIGIYITYNKMYKPHLSIEQEVTNYIGTTSQFINQGKTDFNFWNDKTVELIGNITSINKNGVTLNNIIYCQFRDKIDLSKLKTNELITLKGIVIGYDELLEEFKLRKCILK